MKIGIISDTHIIKTKDKLINLINKELKDVDLIIHAGDYTTKEAVDILKESKNFIGVWGNADECLVKEVLNEKEIIEIFNYKIGIFHGHGEKGKTVDRVCKEFQNDNVDIIVFGHSHQPLVKTKNGIIMINPGSVTSKRREKWFSYVLLDIMEERINVNTIFYNI